MDRNHVVFVYPGPNGWAPVFRLAELAGRYLDADVTFCELVGPGRLAKLMALAGRRSRRATSDLCLFIAAAPCDLVGLLNIPGWRSRFRTVACVVIDSFWTDEVPRTVRYGRLFDHYFITSREDLADWRRQVGDRVSWFPWGSDVLAVGEVPVERPVDVLRVGRQPASWDDDADNGRVLLPAGLKYASRPPGGRTWQEDMSILAGAYGGAKHVLAFSNTAHRSSYTHDTRQYLTGRWTDSLAHGATVAGIAPREPSIDALLWPGATLELGTTERAAGIDVLREACRDWQGSSALHNHRESLARLDWRWRLQHLARTLSVDLPELEADLRLVRERAGPSAVVPDLADC